MEIFPALHVILYMYVSRLDKGSGEIITYYEYIIHPNEARASRQGTKLASYEQKRMEKGENPLTYYTCYSALHLSIFYSKLAS